MYLQRVLADKIIESINRNPVTALLGPRQCGKSTLVKNILQSSIDNIYIDLEKQSDLEKLSEPELFFNAYKNKLICIDEIQRKPEIFPLIRSLTDEWNKNGCFLILGSASRDMLKQSSETLAGRISYKTLTPFLFEEIETGFSIERYLSAGGFPRSILAQDDRISFEWRQDFIRTFLERDLLSWAGFTPETMRRLWKMLAHINGQTANFSALASSLGVSSNTVKNYIDLLSSAFMVNVVEPYFSNLKRRLVKAPKIYISDSGITNALLEINSYENLLSHPSLGAAWESVILANIKGLYPNAQIFFYRSSTGNEIDFTVIIENKIFAVECKMSAAPALNKGNFAAIEDIKPDRVFVVAPVKEGWPMKQGIDVVSLTELTDKINNFLIHN